MPTARMEGPWDALDDLKAERELRRNHTPLKGICPTCMVELSEEPHEKWCPDGCEPA